MPRKKSVGVSQRKIYKQLELELFDVRVIYLKCESDQVNYSQRIMPVKLTWETPGEWVGRNLNSPHLADNHYPKFAWKEVGEDLFLLQNGGRG